MVTRFRLEHSQNNVTLSSLMVAPLLRSSRSLRGIYTDHRFLIGTVPCNSGQTPWGELKQRETVFSWCTMGMQIAARSGSWATPAAGQAGRHRGDPRAAALSHRCGSAREPALPYPG